MPQESIKTINSFLNILEENTAFSTESLQALPEINDELDKLKLEKLDDQDAYFNICQIILNWNKKYPEIQAALKQEPTAKINPKNRPKQEDKNLTIENKFQTPREAIEKLNQAIENTQNKLPQQS